MEGSSTRGPGFACLRRCLGLVLVLGFVPPVLAKGPPRPLADWPCTIPFAGPLAPDAILAGAGSLPAGAWREDPTARSLVDFLSAGENSPAIGERAIADYARKNGPLPERTVLLVVSGLVERGNTLRLVLLDGIKQQIIRSHVLAEALAADDAGGAAGTAAARRENRAALDDADDEAAHLCRRISYDESKLRRLAAALEARTR